MAQTNKVLEKMEEFEQRIGLLENRINSIHQNLHNLSNHVKKHCVDIDKLQKHTGIPMEIEKEEEEEET